MRKRFKSTLAAVLLVPAVVTGCASSAEEKNNDVTLTLASGFASNHANNEGLFMFLDRLKETAPWIDVQFKGGPELMAPNLLVEGLSSGVVDMAVMPGDYYVDQLPAMKLAAFTPFTPMEERENGVVDIYDEIHREQLGVTYLGRVVAGTPQVILSRDPVRQADLGGGSYRTSSATSSLVDRLHGVPVDLPGGEVYTALERNVVSGATWASVGPSSLGLEGVVQHDLAPRFYESLANMMVSEKAWDGLDSRTQDALTDTLAEVEPEIFAHYLSRTVEETEQWRDAGVTESRLEREEAAEVIRIAYGEEWDNLEWDRILETSPAAADLRDAYDVPLGDDVFDRVPGGAFIDDTANILESVS
jgi:TRAP-type C4-dicarboxylate transport system substrate-binding protein